MPRRAALALVLGFTAAAAAPAQELPPLMQPLRQHTEMAREVGVWQGTGQSWMTPDADPVASNGVETVRMMGQFWLVSEYQGEFLGEEFHGLGQMTYDPLAKKYVGTWIDTMAPVMLSMTGEYDVATNELTMMLTGVDPMTSQPGRWKSVTRYVDADHKTFTLYAETPGQADTWWKMMEIKYERRK